MIETVTGAVSLHEGEMVLNIIRKTENKSGIRINTHVNKGYFTVSVFPPVPQIVPEDIEHMEEGMYIGGVGITNRTLPQIDKEIPGIDQRILDETGKIIVLGNGFSNLPILLAYRFAEGRLKTPTVLVDLFNYSLTLEDLSRLRERILSSGLPIPRNLPVYISTLSRICAQIDAGNLVAEEYYIGSGNPPQSIKNADLAINCFGPSRLSILEQISLLGKTGELYTTSQITLLPEGFSNKGLPCQDKRTPATLVKRI